ncbi:MAG: response regulator [Verrucomicrobia bacterium]|nr:response regulator [Verrucomicrobiota bacterium]
MLSGAVSNRLELRLQGGITANFIISVLPLVNGDVRNYLLQFFKLEPSPATNSDPAPAAAPAIDANVAHRQKLDCAMQLARSVSLDFNNALTSILGHTSLLLSKSDPEHPWRNSLGEIEKSAERAAEIANDLANFSRQDKEAPGRKAGNLNELLRQIIDAFRTPENSRIKFQLELERSLFGAKFDEAKLQQAFVRVIENAVQSITGEGVIAIRSNNCVLDEPLEEKTVRLAPGTYLCIQVTDTGCGISPEAMPRIFEPFYTTKGQGHRGLGLAWVYGIVTNHGGGVSVSSKPGEGTTVQVYLPATKRIVRESAGNPDQMCGVETVLVVDDEDLLLNMAQMVLSSFGYRALTANTGLQALEILEREIVDLVITDLVMPNMSGRELIERIRLIAPDVKIVCSSGYLRPQNQPEESYLQKPFTAQDLLRKVRESLTIEQSA